MMKTEKAILAVETALGNAVALKICDKVHLCKDKSDVATRKSGVILKVDSILKEHAVRIEDLCAIGVNTGPGSFTGIRIGIALVKGLARPFDIPIVPVNSFQAISHQLGLNRDHFIIINAGGGFLYAQALSDSYKNDSLSPAMLIHLDNLEENLPENVTVILYGDKLEKVSEKLKNVSPSRTVIESSSPIVDSISLLTEKAVETGHLGSFRDIRPLYIKPSYADI
jgi:tRNA threonylcarbamoyladenosine biosynthesis protein TsaB